MLKRTLEGIEQGNEFSGILVVKASRLLPTRSGKLYLDIELVDRHGRIKGKLWDATREDADIFIPNSFISIRGFIDKYRDELQMKIDGFTPVDASEIDVTQFLPTSRYNTEDMLGYLLRTGESLERDSYRDLWSHILSDEAFVKDFCACPAAVSYHHVFVGGLLEHTCEVVRLCDTIAQARAELDRDLLLTGALIHDIGKIQEYSQGPAFTNLDRGLLLGHIYIGTEMIEDWVYAVESFPVEHLDLLKHMVLGHHGQREYGAPVEPCFPEAIVIHYADNIDAKLNNMRSTITDDDQEESVFTAQRSRMLNLRVLKSTYRELPEDYNPFVAEDEESEEDTEEESNLFPPQ